MYKKLLISFIFITIFNICGYALPCAEQAKIININYNNINYSFIPDSINEAIYYYIPQQIILTKSSELDYPDFQMIKIEALSPASQKQYKAGILQFSLMFQTISSLSEEIKEILKEKVNKETIEFKDLSIEGSNFAFLDSTNKLIQGIQIPSKKFKVISNGNIPIRMELNKDNCDKLEQLVTSKIGLPVIAKINFTGLAEDKGFKITIDYQKAIDELIENKSLRTKFTSFITKKPTVDIAITAAELKNLMVSSSILQIEVIDTKAKVANIDQYISLIADKIVKNIASFKNTINNTNSATSFQASETINIGYGYILKKQEELTQISETIEFSGKTEVSIPLIAKGNISIFPFLNKQKEDGSKFIKTITPSSSQSFFRLPNLNRLSHFNIHNFSIKIKLANEKGKNIPMSPQQAVIADMQDLVWRDNKKNVRSIIAFNIPEKFQNNQNIIYKCDFKISYKIGKKKKSLKFVKEYPVFNGEIPLASIENFIQTITFNGEHLTYNAEGKLRAVVVTLSWGKKKKKVVGNLSGITPKLTFIVPTIINNKKPVIKGTLKFIAKKKKTIKYTNILKERGNNIQIDNSEWQKADN